MVIVIIVSHGNLAENLVKTTTMIAGPHEHLHFIGLNPIEGPEIIKMKMEKIIIHYPQKSEFLILLDLMGGSPFNICAQLMAENRNIEIITGVNLPMLLETILSAGLDLPARELAKIALKKGKEGIIDLRKQLEKIIT